MKYLRRALVVAATIVAVIAGIAGAILAVMAATARALHLI